VSGSKPGARIDLTGQRFGRLVVLGIASYDEKTYTKKWLCRCDCGKKIEVSGGNLRSGHSKSCGCLRRDICIKASTAHGKSRTRLYSIWIGMRKRCKDKNQKNYRLYGGRGIKVCDEWEKNFTVFETWALNNGYAENLSIDRIDSNGNYEPSNCRWATDEVQSNNTRTNHIITFDGETHTVAEWARIKSLKPNVIYNRLFMGWKPEDAIIGKRSKA